jgi:type IV pilus assembly protein PilV
MMTVQSQRGVGLMEVMVAALILAVAVLGFIALQYRSLDAANEAYYRTQAMSVARDLAERMRANQFAQDTYLKELTYSKTTSDVATAENSAPQQQAASEPTPPSNSSCLTNTCTQTQFAQADVVEIKAKAQEVGMDVAMQKCSGVDRNCIYIAWEGTLPKDGDSTTEKNCTNGGTYVDGSRCIVMEAYQ